MAGRRFCQILALVGLLTSVGCASWCAHHYPQQQCCAPACQPCCCPCQPAGYAAPAPPPPTWNQPCTCAPAAR